MYSRVPNTNTSLTLKITRSGSGTNKPARKFLYSHRNDSKSVLAAAAHLAICMYRTCRRRPIEAENHIPVKPIAKDDLSF
jgi:hypothetical protein